MFLPLLARRAGPEYAVELDGTQAVTIAGHGEHARDLEAEVLQVSEPADERWHAS